MAEPVEPLKTEDRPRLRTRDGVTLTARRLTRDDAAALRAFDQSLAPDTRRRFSPHAYDDKTLDHMLSRSETGSDLTLGLFDGSILVGYFFLWHFRKRVPLLGIGLRDAYHRRGLGRQMMDVLLDQARRAGCEGVELTTMQDNHNAFALYRQCGFDYFGDVENRTGDGRIVVERGMFLAFVPGAKRMTDPHGPPLPQEP